MQDYNVRTGRADRPWLTPLRSDDQDVPVEPGRRHHVPTRLTSFVGRDRDIVRVQRLLAGAVQPATVKMIADDLCGSWPTFAGGGANGFP